MAKTIRKILWGDLFNTREYEEYFSEMSREGLHLKKLGRSFAYFEEGEPNYLNYKVDLVSKDEDKKEIRIRQYKRRGWDLAGNKGNFLVFSSPINSGAEELYENPEEQKLAIENVKRELFGGGITSIVLVVMSILLLILMLYQRAKMEGGFYLLLTREELIVPVILALISLLKDLERKRNFKRLQKSLDTEEYSRYSGDYLLMRNKSIIKKSIYLFITLFIIVSLFYKVSKDKYINLSEIDNLDTLPVISIGDIETLDYSRDESSLAIIKGDIDYGNYIHSAWNLLVPREYSLSETGIFEKGNYEGEDPRLDVHYYLGRTETIAKGLEKNLASRKVRRYTAKFIKIQENNEYIVYGGEKEGTKSVLVRKGREIVLVDYYDGTASVEDIVEAVVERLGGENPVFWKGNKSRGGLLLPDYHQNKPKELKAWDPS